jgi:NitT/TauT family transport system permease protein
MTNVLDTRTQSLDVEPATFEEKVIEPPRQPFNPIKIIGPVAVFGLVMAFWYGGRMLLARNKRFLIPPPHRIITDAMLDKRVRADVLKATWLDIKVAVIGLTIAIVLGVTIAIVMSLAKWLEISFWPYLVALQAIPILTVSPLIGAIMGYESTPRIFVTVIITIFPIISNTLFGISGIDKGFHDLFTLHGASRWTRLVKLQLPAASPAIFAGFRISAGLAVIGAIVGDVFFRAGEAGLGLLVDVYSSRLRGPETWLVILTAAALGLVFFAFFGLLERLFVGRWNGTKQ